jgi:hypothetical protein
VSGASRERVRPSHAELVFAHIEAEPAPVCSRKPASGPRRKAAAVAIGPDGGDHIALDRYTEL